MINTSYIMWLCDFIHHQLQSDRFNDSRRSHSSQNSQHPSSYLTNMFLSKAFLVAVFCVVATVATTFKNCEDGPAPTALRVEGCDAEPCVFIRGENVNAEWDFGVVEDTDNLKPVVNATALGVTINYPLPEKNACNSLINGECPLDAGEAVTYGLNMPILKSYPKVSLKLEFALLDNNNNVHVCFKLDAKVADK